MKIIRGLPQKHFIAVVFAVATLLPLAPAHAEISAWAENTGGRMRLVALPPEPDGSIRAALQIEPKPGWITYWREPGTSGIPPQITVDPEGSVALDAVAYPVPKHIVNGTANDIAYDAPVTLPLTMSARISGPVKLDAVAFVGICKEICIPFQANFSMVLKPVAQSHPQEEAIFQAAAASLPKPPSPEFNVTAHALSPDMKQLSLTVTLPQDGGAVPEVIVTGPSGHVFTRQMDGSRNGRDFKGTIEIGMLPKGYDISGKSWGVLIIDGARAMETTLAFE
jgi:DsbC/DsbD-like thiol-disulfide interchange protein